MAVQAARVQHGAEIQAGVLDTRRVSGLGRFQYLGGGHDTQAVDPVRGKLQCIQQHARTLRRRARTRGRDLLATHGHGAMKQASSCRHGHQCGDLGTAAGLAEHRDVAGIAAEFVRVFAYPVQRLDQIQLPDIARPLQVFTADLGQVEIAEGIQPVIDRDHHYVAATAQVHAVIERAAAGTVVVAAAVDVEQDRTLAPIVQPWRIHVEEQAVFAAGTILGAALRCGGAKALRIADAGPWKFRQCWHEPPRRRIGAVRYALEHLDAAIHETAHASTARAQYARRSSLLRARACRQRGS